MNMLTTHIATPTPMPTFASMERVRFEGFALGEADGMEGEGVGNCENTADGETVEGADDDTASPANAPGSNSTPFAVEILERNQLDCECHQDQHTHDTAPS